MNTKLILFILFPLFLTGSGSKNSTPASAEDVIDLIKKNVTCPWEEKTVDTFKAGDPSLAVSGIAVCMFADLNVMKKAVEQNCNLIITHEPIFYNHLDETAWLKNDRVYEGKLKYIRENGLVIWRFHDHWHNTQPDGIDFGMVKALGWENNRIGTSNNRFRFPETTLSAFAEKISARLNLQSVRIIGDPDLLFTNVVFSAGAPGGRSQINTLNEEQTEVLVGGEVPEWETYMYVNDAMALGKKKGVILLGHIKSEEGGMEYCAAWLKSFLHDIPVKFIADTPDFVVK